MTIQTKLTFGFALKILIHVIASWNFNSEHYSLSPHFIQFVFTSFARNKEADNKKNTYVRRD